MSVATQYPASNGAHGALGQLTNPTYTYADDASYTTGAPAKNTSIGNAYGTFGFDTILPASCTITKVQLIYEYYTSTTASNATARVHSLVSGSAQTNHDDTTEPASATVITVNITADRSWTRANLLDGVLTVALEAVRGSSTTAVTFYFDYVKVEVTYTQTASGSFTLSGKGNLSTTGVKGIKGSFTLAGKGNTTFSGIKGIKQGFSLSGKGNTIFEGSGSTENNKPGSHRTSRTGYHRTIQ